jgi:hypothetical protein
MRVSDVFTMGAGYGSDGSGNGDEYFSENPCYQGRGCVRDVDPVEKYCDPRSRRRGLAHILGGLLGNL